MFGGNLAIFAHQGCFIRWLIMGDKGSYREFYEKTHTNYMMPIDCILGVAVFFLIMYLWIELL